jgi:hypothetical protein
MDKAGLTEIHVEYPDGSIKIVQNTHLIEKHLLQVRQTNHFGQSKGTPLTKEPYRTCLGIGTDTEWANIVVQGGSFPQTDPDINKVWTFIQQINQKSYGQEISQTDPISTIKKVHESSASSASGLHYGHYKCLVKGAPCQDDTEKQKMADHQNTILDTITKLVNICLMHGFPLECWLKITSVMIPKQVGNFLKSKLRTIHLCETDYQLLKSNIIISEGINQLE